MGSSRVACLGRVKGAELKASETQGWVRENCGLRSDDRGAVFVEFLIAFLPVYVLFLCLVQLTILFSVRLITEHAAVHAARAAAVVIGDDRKRYGGERENELEDGGRRERAVRNAAILTLAPLILNGLIQNVDVFYPPPDQPDGDPQTGNIRFPPMTDNSVGRVRVRVEVEAACRIGFANHIACPTLGSFLSPDQSRRINFFMPTRWVRAEAIYPYQGARYQYPP